MSDISNSLIETIVKNNIEKPESMMEDIQSIDFKESQGDFVIDRYYQRNYIQTTKNASAYIESIFLGLVIPEIQVYENYETGYKEVVDGQQRLLSLLKFYRNEYSLTGLKYLTFLNGKSYEELPTELKNIYKKYYVRMRVSKNTDSEYKFLLFERLNVGSEQLNVQEIRNCIFRNSEILHLAKRLSSNDTTNKIFGKFNNDRFYRDEVILNILSLSLIETPQSFNKKKRIDKLLGLDFSNDKKNIDAFEKKFIKISSILTEYSNKNTLTFFKSQNGFLESIYVALLLEDDLNPVISNFSLLEKEILKVISTEEFLINMTTGVSQNTSECLRRINLIRMTIKEFKNQ